jgi:methylthioribulose-1-phosphate dehydratase
VIFPQVARQLIDIGARFYARGWVMGTSGNLSAVVSAKPLRLAITASAVHKGTLRPSEILLIDDAAKAQTRRSKSAPTGVRSSAETLLHLEIVRRRGAGAVLHTHSVWSTILSDLHEADRGLSIQGYEMLKGLSGVDTHTHREWIPIVPNSQDMPRLAQTVGQVLDEFAGAHAFLLARHGLYTWGRTLAEAERHVEILEFLFEALGRTRGFHGDSSHSRTRPDDSGR